MGVVYLARELSSGRELALKVLPADLCASEEAFGRFQREAVLAASISDSRCVFVYGAHQFEGSPAIAMELVRGQTLEQVIKRGETVPVRQAVRWAIELLEGLDAAHHAGVLHRDVKPSNCFVAEDGHVKIGDFGLSRSLDADVHLTQSGTFLGSPLYAAPEQVTGRKVDERSDMLLGRGDALRAADTASALQRHEHRRGARAHPLRATGAPARPPARDPARPGAGAAARDAPRTGGPLRGPRGLPCGAAHPIRSTRRPAHCRGALPRTWSMSSS